jgi:DNA repair exonuclease SbcCD ATPase subunit
MNNMEITQLEQMIRWLDEERKRDKAQIAALNERAEQQMQLIQAQSTEIESMRQEIVTLRTDIRRTDDYPGMIETTHRDLNGMVEALKTLTRRERQEAETTRRAEIEMLNDMISEVDKKIRPLFRYEEQLAARAAGEQRLQGQVQTTSNTLSDLSKRTEDRLQSIVYLEEQRRADTRRIAEVEGELPGLRKRGDELVARLIRLEDNIRKLPARVDEAIQVAKSYEPRIEELRVADFQREQRVKKYLDQAQQVDGEVQRLVEQTQRYALLYNQNKQALESLTAFEVRLEKRQNEIAEMQRLTEDRLLRQWEEWQGIFARDWQKRAVAEEDRWRRQDLDNQKTVARFTGIDEQIVLHYQELVSLWEDALVNVERWSRALQDLVKPSQAQPAEHLKSLRRYAEEKRKELILPG